MRTMKEFLFTEEAHAELSTLFNPEYSGYKPEQAESPNSDGRVDAAKRYLHVAPKYNPPAFAQIYLAAAHYEACKIAERIGVPKEFYPKAENGTLRVLDYPPGAGTLDHTDFDLFTVNLWRSTPNDHEQFGPVNDTDCDWTQGAPEFHMGRIGQMVGLGSAVPHRVPPRTYAQKAIIYFAMPADAAVFPSDAKPDTDGKLWSLLTVSHWLADVYSKSRVAAAPKY